MPQQPLALAFEEILPGLRIRGELFGRCFRLADQFVEVGEIALTPLLLQLPGAFGAFRGQECLCLGRACGRLRSEESLSRLRTRC